MTIRHYTELSRDELYEILQFRQEVFVVEQDCPYLDADGEKDFGSWHAWLTDGSGRIIAYCRILPEGVGYAGYAAIGRVISRQDSRRTGAGRRVMEEALAWTDRRWPGLPVKISAQAYLEDFYRSLGFVPTGEAYLEDGIPHLGMVRKNIFCGSAT